MGKIKKFKKLRKDIYEKDDSPTKYYVNQKGEVTADKRRRLYKYYKKALIQENG